MSRDKQVEYYENLLKEHGDHYLSLDWKSPESQGIRFRVFEELFAIGGKINNFSVLDIGSGFGDLYGFLKKKGYKFRYSGYDIAPKIVETAKKKYPDAHFEVKDILEDKKPEQADYVFCCGTLNINLGDPNDHLEFIRSMLLRMFELCKIGVGANFLSSQAVYQLPEEALKQSQYFYSRPEDIAGFAKGITSRFILRHDYHPGDFTVYLLKK